MAPRPAMGRKRASNTVGPVFFVCSAAVLALVLGRAAINSRFRCSGAASFVAVPSAAAQPRPTKLQPLPPQPQPPSLERRRAANGVLLSMLGASAPLVVEKPLVARAEGDKVGYQVQLPRLWATYQQRGNPGLGDKASKALFVAGSAAEKIEAQVVRIPLAVTRADPQGLGGLALIDYFSTPSGQEPRVTKEQVVDILSKGVASDVKSFRFNITGTTTEFFRNVTKYLRYDYEVVSCSGDITEGQGGNRECTLEGLEKPTTKRHHAVVSAVLSEPAKGQVADGILLSDTGAEVLWVVDASAPIKSWPNVSAQVDQFLASFSVGTEAQLTALRGR